jgi:hypothetical protein
MMSMQAEVDQLDQDEVILKATQLAARLKRPLYVLQGEIYANRPKSGPFSIAWPSGAVTASGLGRKRIRHKRRKPTDDEE